MMMVNLSRMRIDFNLKLREAVKGLLFTFKVVLLLVSQLNFFSAELTDDNVKIN